MSRPRPTGLALVPRGGEHRDLFLARYEMLLRRARQLAEGDEAHARDLVHDLFVQVVLHAPSLSDIDNLDAYLYAMLRNLRLSAVRRAARAKELPIIEYDSADLGLRLRHTEAARLQARDELAVICRWACERKEESKTGSALILRFFLGYFPEEIARVFRCRTHSVTQWLLLARREVTAALREPAAPTARARQDVWRTPAPREADETPADWLAAARAAIAASRRGPCLTDADHQRFYGPHAVDVPSCSTLAHIVSCAACLDAVNRVLDLDDRSQRWPLERLGQDTRRRGAHRAERDARLCEDRLRETHAHAPRALEVFVNGFQVGGQAVRSRVSEMSLRLPLAEPIRFVELFSEQGLRVMYVPVTPPPDGPVRQESAVRLDAGRHAAVEVSFTEPWPELRVLYVDPDVDTGLEPFVEEAAAPASVVGREARAPGLTHGARDLFARILRLLTPAWAERGQPIGRRRWALTFASVMLAVWLALGSPEAAWAAFERAARGIAEAIRAAIESVSAPRSLSPRVLPSRGIGALSSDTLPSFASRPVAPRATIAATPVNVTAAALAELEVELLDRLDRADALSGEQVSLTRAASGSGLRLSAIVDTPARKASLLAALEDVRHHPALRLDVVTAAEQMRRLRRDPTRPATRHVDAASDERAVTDVLQRYFADEGRSGAAPAADAGVVRAFADDMVQRADAALKETWALQGLAAHAPTRHGGTIDARTIARWHELIARRSGGVRAALDAIDRGLRPVFRPHAPIAADHAPPRDPGDIPDTVARLVERVTQIHHAIVSTLAAGAGGRARLSPGTPAFWTDLHHARALAADVEHAPRTTTGLMRGR